ncbi:MAG: hypothetical protein HY810_08625 [Candidatus Omnitrophica bacterium]|nr:hypothetical protein [Candidatus Omnitrophota bacterium]
MRVSFQTPNCCFTANFNYTDTAKQVFNALPVDAKICLWGEEIYFKTDIKASAENATKNVDIGDVAYWPQGRAICVFFGTTPLSTDEKPVPTSEVVVIGRINVNPAELQKIKRDDSVRVMSVIQKEKTPSDILNAPADKKLTQEEIDVLVKHLLEEKKRKAQQQ